MWYESGRRDLGRDWHKLIDARVGPRYDEAPYWQQYEWAFPQDLVKWYVEDTFYAGPFAFSGGVQQYLIGVSRSDRRSGRRPTSASIPTRSRSSPAA